MTTPPAAGSDYVGGLPPGFLLHEYELSRVLGHGGFGVTYLAQDTMLQKPVAIKEYLPTEWAVRASDQTVSVRSSNDREAYEHGMTSFLNEARVLARFSHPNLIAVYRYFRAHNTAYFVMEYVEGSTLRAFMKQGMPTEARIREIMLPVMAGLEGVHREGILHRDIKPDNILVKNDGGPILIDFGAARYTTGSASKAITSVLTVGFAPIEQYSTHGGQGPWTDIYALGAVMYFLIGGRKPIDAVARMERDSLPCAREIGEGRFSPGFLAAIDWALRVKASERPQNLQEFRDALEGRRAVPDFVTAGPSAESLDVTRQVSVPVPVPTQAPAPEPTRTAPAIVDPTRVVTVRGETAAPPAPRASNRLVLGAGVAGVVAVLAGAAWMFGRPSTPLPAATVPASTDVTPAKVEAVPKVEAAKIEAPAPKPEPPARKAAPPVTTQAPVATTAAPAPKPPGEALEKQKVPVNAVAEPSQPAEEPPAPQPKPKAKSKDTSDMPVGF